MSLESRIKKHIHAQPHSLVIFHPRGFDSACADEVKEALDELAMSDRFAPAVKRTETGIRVENIHYRSMLELGLRLRTARDIFWVLGRGRAASVDEVKRRALKPPWELIFPSNTKVTVRVALRASRMRHEGIVKTAVEAALTERGLVVSAKDATELLDVRLENNQLQLALSFAPSPLFHRGYKEALSGSASIKEDLAACLIRSAWKENGTKPKRIFCPFAGSGTLGFEAILALSSVPASVFRDDLSFLNWLPSSGSTAHYIERALLERAAAAVPESVAFRERSGNIAKELEASAKSFARTCRTKGVVLKDLSVEEEDFLTGASLPAGSGEVFVPLNPPYGRRLKTATPPAELYRATGARLEALAAEDPGLLLSGFVLCPSKTCESACRGELRSYRTRSADCLHGGKTIRVLYYRRRDS